MTAKKTVTVEPQINGKPVEGVEGKAAFTITLKPLITFTKTHVNGKKFNIREVDSFPRTGFAGAKFQLEINGNRGNNRDYTWESTDPNVSVDRRGNVTINAIPSSQGVTITARDKDRTDNTASYQFLVKKWFMNSGAEKFKSFDEAKKFCTDLDSVIALYPYAGAVAHDGNDTLWGEWGLLDNHGWKNGGYWIDNRDEERFIDVLFLNNRLVVVGHDATGHAVCSKDL